MPLDKELVANSFDFDAEQLASLRRQWLKLMDLVVFGELCLNKLGALPRLRKRFLEVGENFATLVGDRLWISQPREQLKSALGSSLKLRDSLLALERSAVLLSGGADAPAFESALLTFRQDLLAFVEACENRWAALLESQLDDDSSE